MLASCPASMVNQKQADLGIPNRFNLTPSRSSAAMRRLLLLRPLDAFQDQPVGVLGAAPAQHLHPLALFEILVVLEEVLDLLQRDVGKVAVRPDLVVALGQL